MSWNKEADPDKSPDALRLSSLLVEGIANHVVNLEVPNCDEFQESIRKLRQQLERAASPAEGLAAAGQTVKLLEVHNREVERNAKLRLRELSSVISTLIKTVVKLGGAGEGWAINIKSLAADLDNTYKIEDLRLIRDKVSASLRDISEQNLLHRDAASIRSLAAEGTIKILVADDDPAIAALVTAVLHNHKMVCFVAKDGPETLEMAGRLAPNLLLLDVNMPVHDGFETLTMLKADTITRSIPTVLLTGCDESTQISRGLRLGALDYILKPFGALDLAARVKKQLRKSLLEQANLV